MRGATIKTVCSHSCSKNTRILNVMLIGAVGAELFSADGRTDGRKDMTKIIVTFRNFAKAPKNFTNSDSIYLI
jgi:hypothetical protein